MVEAAGLLVNSFPSSPHLGGVMQWIEVVDSYGGRRLVNLDHVIMIKEGIDNKAYFKMIND